MDFGFEDDFGNLDNLLSNESFREEVADAKLAIDKGDNEHYVLVYQNQGNSDIQHYDASDAIVQANEGLALKVAHYYSRFSTPAFDENDMVQTARLSLLKAAGKYEFGKNAKFSTYAVIWMRQAILRGIADYSTTVRVPVHLRERIRKMTRIENEYWGKFGTAMSDEELLRILDMSPESLKLAKIGRNFDHFTSLDLPVGERDDTYLGDMVGNPDAVDAESLLYSEELRIELARAMNRSLTKREQKILEMRFGLNGDERKTLEEIGLVFGLTRERIRQLEVKSLKKLNRSNILNEHIKEYL
jgi:RNA polymerase primary sigma factor